MPLAFPSHQGLILPIWRMYPKQIDGVALCVGAAMPDIVDGIAWPFRGELGQWLGHSLVGIVVCVPPGLLLVNAARQFAPQKLIMRLNEGAPPSAGLVRASVSLAIGALSHIVFDLITHGNFPLLWPWYVNNHAFPAWWYHTWASVPLLVYKNPYPIAPHTVAWMILTIVGAVVFIRCLRRSPSH
ncbi:MAG: DUF4184 family protein [Planctomycetota bacterium]